MTYFMPQFWSGFKCVFVESAGVVFGMFTILTYFSIRTRHNIRYTLPVLGWFFWI